MLHLLRFGTQQRQVRERRETGRLALLKLRIGKETA